VQTIIKKIINKFNNVNLIIIKFRKKKNKYFSLILNLIYEFFFFFEKALYNRTEKLEMQFQILQEKILSNSSNNDKFLIIDNNINALNKKFD
jgi:hypothetical protein